MPVEKANIGLYDVKDLMVVKSGDGYAMQLVCPRATAFVLCFSKGTEPIDCESLNLTDTELEDLHNNAMFERNGCRLQGVMAHTFMSMPQFKGFKVNPPELVQVWSMSRNNFGTIKLYKPLEEAAVFVPLNYSVQFGMAGNCVTLQVGLDPKKLDNYTDGSILYQVSGMDPVPIPRSWLNRPFRLNAPNKDAVKIVVSEQFQNMYRQD